MNKQEKYRGRQKGGGNAAGEEGPGTTFGAGGARVTRESGVQGGGHTGQREREALGVGESMNKWRQAQRGDVLELR